LLAFPCCAEAQKPNFYIVQAIQQRNGWGLVKVALPGGGIDALRRLRQLMLP
jgi:hypothetical protein